MTETATGLAWDAPARALVAPGDNAPVLAVAGYEGPLDWLLEMVRAQKIDLGRLSILSLVEAFASALESGLAGVNGATAPLGRWGDWLVMAATLTLLRSRLLLPADASEAKAAEAEAESLRRSLLDRAQASAAADWLDARTQPGRDVFGRGWDEVASENRVGDITELLRGCLVVLRLPENLETYLPRPPPFWRVTDAIARFEDLLGQMPEEGAPIAAFLPAVPVDARDRDLRCRAAVASTLLGGLELAKTGALTMTQGAVWTSILILSGSETPRR